MLWILAAIGYVANGAQGDASQTGIAALQTLVPGGIALAAVVIISFYPLTNAKLAQIQADLLARAQAQPD